MPKIEWTNLPEAIRKHLLLRLKERKPLSSAGRP
jgi:hypothetical protein